MASPEDDAQAALVAHLLADNRALRSAGCDLAAAAVRVVQTYDGVHRLALAVAAWMQALGNEGGRPHGQQPDVPDDTAPG